MAVGVNIVSTFDSKGITKAIKDFQSLQGAGNKATFGLRTFDKGMTNTLKAVGKLATGVAVAAGAIGYSLVKSAIQAQAEQDRLRQILLTTGAATDKQVKSLIAQAEALEKVGVASAGNIITAQAQLATFDLQFETIQKLTPAITDYVIAEKGASATAEDFKSMTNGLAQALNGQFGALTRAGFVLDKNTKGLISNGTEAERAAAIVDVLSSTYGGFNEAIAKTPEGRLVALKNSFESLRTELGTLLLPAFEKIVTFIQTQLIPYLSKLAGVIGEKGVGAALGVLATDLLTATTNMGTFGNIVLGLTSAFVALRLIAMAATISVSLFNVALFSNPIGIVVAAVIALGVALVALYLKFEVVRTVINTIALVLKTAFMNVIEAVYNAFAVLYNGIAQGINLLIKGANLFGANIPEIEMLGYKAFTVIGNAAETAGKQIGASKKSIDAYGSRLDALAATFKTGGGGGGGFGGGGVTKTIETAKEKLQKYVDALKGMSSAQKAARDADKSLMKSRTSLAEATTKLTDAQAYFNQVIAGYGADSKQAKDRQLALRKAQGAVERAGYDVESSVFAVTRAEQELAAVRLDPESSAQAIREAEIALAEAKLGVKDATESQVEATNSLTEAETLLDEAINGAKEGSDAYTEALDKLNDAKKAQVDATDAVTEAIERQTEAVERLREAEEKAAEARKGIPTGAATTAETDAGVAPKATGGLYGSFMEAVRGLHPNSPALKSKTPVTQAKKDFPKLYAQYKAAGLAMAQGGIITKPTQVLAGENGKEAIIPLDRLESGMTVNLTINAGMGTDPAKLGDEIVDVLTRYQRRNGALPLKVA
jgi:uncharacterized membrane protein YeaQ/YmgE (transglycosylase-associated protein family)